MVSVLSNRYTNNLKGSDALAWNFTSDRPIYLQISDKITAGILSGEYKRGEKLPSVREFAEIAAVNPNTVQRALAELETVGLIDNQRTTGKFVTQEEARISDSRDRKGRGFAVDFLDNMAAINYESTQAIGLLTEVAASKEDESNG